MRIRRGSGGLCTGSWTWWWRWRWRGLMGNKELRIKMGKEGRKLMRNYSPKVIWDTWETLMNRVVQQKNEKGV